MPPLPEDRLPGALIERFTGDLASRLVALLRFLSPSAAARGGHDEAERLPRRGCTSLGPHAGS
jgi:hypothetical protein